MGDSRGESVGLSPHPCSLLVPMSVTNSLPLNKEAKHFKLPILPLVSSLSNSFIEK